MFGIGITELLVIGVVLLIAVGPNKIPEFVKTGVAMYRQLRRATRDLRASTGIDEILQDEDLRDLRRPLNIPLSKKGKPNAPAGAIAAAPKPVVAATPMRRGLSDMELDRECPREGVDLAELREVDEVIDEAEAARIRAEKSAASDAVRNAKLTAMQPPPAEGHEYEKIVAAKHAEAARDDEIVAAKLASVAPMDEDEPSEEDQRIVAAKIAAAEREDDPSESEDDRRIIAQKRAAIVEPEEEESRRVIAAKLAAVAEKAAAYQDPAQKHAPVELPSEGEAVPAPKKKKKTTTRARKAEGSSDG